tara:strand:- start:497 stop:706 length:210 start_codon:yes stop_codon:yes gene_type:complete
LQAEKERLLYDVQRRPHDTDDDRNAIQRGLLATAGDEQPGDTNSGSTSLSEAGGPAPLALVRVRVPLGI